MTAKELFTLLRLLAKFRAAFGWCLSGRDRDGFSGAADSALRAVRVVIRNGGSYAHQQFSIAK